MEEQARRIQTLENECELLVQEVRKPISSHDPLAYCIISMLLASDIQEQQLQTNDRDSSQYVGVRVGFKRLNFDRDTGTDYWRTFLIEKTWGRTMLYDLACENI